MNLNKILERLWTDYTEISPSAQKIYDLLTGNGKEVVNDHIAFRTFNNPLIGIDALAKPFIECGYQEKGNYNFDEKQLKAKHFEFPGHPGAPKIFISELITGNFSKTITNTLNKCLTDINKTRLQSGELIFSGRLWDIPDYTIYQQLLKESEYAAWLYVYGFRANHFTVDINSLKQFKSIESLNIFLKDNGFELNDSGGEIKGSKKELLQQSSTLAEIIPIQFIQGNYFIPSCYYEFAKRYTNSKGLLYNGFIAKSANKIFESTNFRSS